MIRLNAVLAFIFWFLYLFTDLLLLLSKSTDIDSGIHETIPNFLLNFFVAFLYLYHKYKIKRVESADFTNLLWNIFMTGFFSTLVSLILRMFVFVLGDSKLAKSLFLLDTLYIVNIGLVAIFLIAVFAVWKRLILYQKSKFLLKIWTIFEYTLVLSLVFNVLPIELPEAYSLYYIVLLVLMGLFLSVNMRWVAYLNFKQKWKSILLISLILSCIGYFANVLFESVDPEIAITNTIFENTFLMALMIFTFIYALLSLLVIIFNLPTSSVFEKKLQQVINFQRLSQSIQSNQNEEQVYKTLLNSAVSTVMADGAWIELFQESSEPDYFKHQISEERIDKIKDYLIKNKTSTVFDNNTNNSLKPEKYSAKLKNQGFKSILAFGIHVQKKKIGTLVLLKEVVDGFDEDTSDIIETFVSQTEISVENYRLLNQAIVNERYKEQLKIAQKVQSSLLPEKLDTNADFEIAAFSIAADEVGGDYYDSFRIDENKVILIIGDVSGKGTSAAFHMSQMKGIFHSLAQMNLSTKEFLSKSNTAISKCLEKTSFITTTVFIIDQKSKTIEFSRAGHCPTLYYDSKKNVMTYFANQGLGLGILRNDDFHHYIEINKRKYASGDIMLLYTDGITEAKNKKGEEYGYDRLKEIIMSHVTDPPDITQQRLIEDLHFFTGTEFIDDDYTALILKFRDKPDNL